MLNFKNSTITLESPNRISTLCQNSEHIPHCLKYHQRVKIRPNSKHGRDPDAVTTSATYYRLSIQAHKFSITCLDRGDILGQNLDLIQLPVF